MNILNRIQSILSPFGHIPSYAGAYIIETIIVLIFSVTVIAGMVYFFRKYMARVQNRIGPNRVGKFGVLQVMADGLKLMQKESIFPDGRDDLPYKLAPIIVFMGLILAFIMVPYSNLYWFGSLTITHSNVGIILIFAVLAIMPIGEILAGISSNNKYAMLGALRAVAKDISFEVPMMLSILAIIMISSANTFQPLNLQNIVSVQSIPFGILEPIGLFIFFVSMIARASYSPFDMGESDSELVTGDTTEYGGLRFGMFYMGLFGTIFLGSMLVSVLYLGGGSGPFESSIGFVWFMVKTIILVIISLTVWLSMPRVRIDKFVNFGWKILLPLSFINLVITGIIILSGIGGIA